MCPGYAKILESQNVNLDGDPPLELQVSVKNYIMGFEMKLDSGKFIQWGTQDSLYQTGWSELGGPVIGFHFKGR